jgi:hypothetical protein
MHNMMIRPSETELQEYGEPEFTILNAGACTADPSVEGVTSTTSVAINLEAREMVILGTEYAGEMKKGIFSVMHYLMPLKGVLTLHSGCNMGAKGDVTLFFGLSGTGVLCRRAPMWECALDSGRFATIYACIGCMQCGKKRLAYLRAYVLLSSTPQRRFFFCFLSTCITSVHEYIQMKWLNEKEGK